MINMAEELCQIAKNSEQIRKQKRIDDAVKRFKEVSVQGYTSLRLVYSNGLYTEPVMPIFDPQNQRPCVCLRDEDLQVLSLEGFKIDLTIDPAKEIYKTEIIKRWFMSNEEIKKFSHTRPEYRSLIISWNCCK